MAIVIDGCWRSTEAVYALEVGEEALQRQTTLPEREVDRDEQLKLVDLRPEPKPSSRELYEQARERGYTGL